MELDNLEQEPAAEEPPAKKARQGGDQESDTRPKSGRFVDREFHQSVRDRLTERQDLGESMADTVRLGEGPHWKQRYYFEKFKVKQDDLVDFLQRIRKAYMEGLCWVLVYYYQGCTSWTWFYPYHYAPFASDLIGASSLKCSDPNYFHKGMPFMPFQQLMSVLPPVSSEEAGIPVAMRELMRQPFSPLADFFPLDFGLDLNGKRYTWQAVILLPFIDEPRLVRILTPLLKVLTPGEKIRNRRGNELIYGHVEDKSLLHAVQLAQAAYEAGHSGLKQTIRDKFGVGFIEGYQHGGAGRTIVSPIEGLPDVEESHSVSAWYYGPEMVPHSSKMLPGITEHAVVVNAADLDEQSRMKGFGGEPARRMIMQALGKDPNKKPNYGPSTAPVSTKPKLTPAQTSPAPIKFVQEESGHWGDDQEDEWSGAPVVPSHPEPPPGAKVIRIKGARQGSSTVDAQEGYRPVRRRARHSGY